MAVNPEDPKAVEQQAENAAELASVSINQDRRSVLRKLAVGTAVLSGSSILPSKWTIPVLEFGALPAHAVTSGGCPDPPDGGCPDDPDDEIPGEDDPPDNDEVSSPDNDDIDIPEIPDIPEDGDDEWPLPPDNDELPEIPDWPNPDDPPTGNPGDEVPGTDNSVTVYYGGVQVEFDGIWQNKFVFSKLGPEYGRSFTLVWSDGYELHIPDATQMTMNGQDDDFRKYQPGGPYSANNPDIPTMEVYAKRSTLPESVTLYY